MKTKFENLAIRPTISILNHCPICGSLPMILLSEDERRVITIKMCCSFCRTSLLNLSLEEKITDTNEILQKKEELKVSWMNKAASYFN